MNSASSRSTQSLAPSPWVQTLQAADCGQFSSLIAGEAAAEFVQVGPGSFRAAAARIRLGSVVLHWISCRNDTACRAHTQKGGRYAVIPLRHRGPWQWNDQPVRQPTVYAWDDEYDFFCRGADSEVVSLAFDGAAFTAHRAAWAGGEAPAAAAAPGGVARGEARELLPLLQALLQASRQPDAFQQASARHSFACALATCLLRAEAAPLAWADAPRDGASPARIMRRADDYLRSHLSEPVCLLDLCRATRASARSLNYAFHSVLGVPPLRYLRLRRFNLAHRLLCQSRAGNLSVKAVALHCGFLELGRFAVEYRRLFGERPSQTLAHDPQP